jgi:hypothetical protein
LFQPVSGAADTRREKAAERLVRRNFLGVPKPAGPLVLAAGGDERGSKEPCKCLNRATAIQGASLNDQCPKGKKDVAAHV